MYTIHLHQIECFAFHGIYEEERILGNKFIVDVDIDVEIEEKIVSINDTIDYSLVYDIVKSCMDTPTDLIEIVAEEMAALIHQKFPKVKNVKITIQKTNPPVTGFIGNVAISLQKKF